MCRYLQLPDPAAAVVTSLPAAHSPATPYVTALIPPFTSSESKPTDIYRILLTQ